MVVFTCQHCNEALKKPVVEKHYNTVCRRNPYLTCVDCLVDFRGDEYTKHTSCVSEDQRYGDKNFVPKAVAVKQNNWIEVVQSVIQRNENPKFKSIFQKLSNYSNVPRKKPKFVNFLKNGLRINDEALAGEIFDAFQNEFMKNSKNNKTVTDSNTNDINTESIENGESENLNGSVNGTAEEPTEKSKKKKKKDKKRNNISECSDAPVKDETLEDDVTGSSKKDKKKKSKKQKVEESEVPSEENDVNLDASVCSTNSEKKKKKKSLSEDKENNKENQVEQETDISNIEEHDKSSIVQQDKLSKKELKKLKKKQKYEAELKEIENAPNVEEPEENNEAKKEEEEVSGKSKAKKQKKRKASESEADSLKKQKVEETHEEKNEVENTLEAEVIEPNPKNKFDWEEIIKELLRKSSDHEMAIKRLSKKVLSEYQAVKGERETFEELMSKFNKKINKIPGVRILKDKAKLIAED